MENSSRLLVESGNGARAADLTGNGWLDLVIGGKQCFSKNYPNESYVYIYWGGPDGFREHRKTQLPAHSSNSLAIADFDNDGILDIFSTSYNNGRERDLDAYLYHGSPGGVYSAYNRSRLFTHSSCGCLAADFNGDGWVDLAVAEHKAYGNHAGSSRVFWNGPEGFSERNSVCLPALGPHGMLPVDPGNITDRGEEEYYESSAFRLPRGMSAKKAWWEAEVPPGTRVRMQLRFAREEGGLSDARWVGAEGGQGWIENGSGLALGEYAGMWMQYRLALGAVSGCGSPRVREVNIAYCR